MTSLLPGAAEKAEWGSTLPPGLPYNSCSPGYENARQVFSGQGRLYGITAYSSRASSQYILIFDSIAAPASGAVPTLPALPVNASAAAGLDFGPEGRWFQRGCWLANSSTANSLTAGSADTWFDAQYVPLLPLGSDSTVSA